jgi:hypothetical protein
MSKPRRDWKLARAKVDREGECRVCHTPEDLQAAHTVGREHDPDNGRVRDIDIVPLCIRCHAEYDGRRLNLIPYLSMHEQAAAVEHLGIDRAIRRLSSGQCAVIDHHLR